MSTTLELFQGDATTLTETISNLSSLSGYSAKFYIKRKSGTIIDTIVGTILGMVITYNILNDDYYDDYSFNNASFPLYNTCQLNDNNWYIDNSGLLINTVSNQLYENYNINNSDEEFELIIDQLDILMMDNE